MKLQLLVLSMALASNLAFASQPDRAPADQLVPFSSELKGLSSEDAHQEDQVVMAQDDEVIVNNEVKPEIKEELTGNKEKSLDELDTEAAILAKKAERLEKEAAELRKKSEKLAKKSQKHEKKSEILANKSEKAEDDSEAKIKDSEEKLADSKELLDQIEASPDKESREIAITKLCEKKISRRSLLKVFDRRSKEKKLEACITEYRVASLKKKEKLKKKHIGSQCEISLGVSISCPEGIYKFMGNNSLAQVSDDERSEIKEVEEKKVDTESVATASAQ